MEGWLSACPRSQLTSADPVCILPLLLLDRPGAKQWAAWIGVVVGRGPHSQQSWSFWEPVARLGLVNDKSIPVGRSGGSLCLEPLEWVWGFGYKAEV